MKLLACDVTDQVSTKFHDRSANLVTFRRPYLVSVVSECVTSWFIHTL